MTPVSRYAWDTSSPKDGSDSQDAGGNNSLVLTCRPYDACVAVGGELQCGEGYIG